MQRTLYRTYVLVYNRLDKNVCLEALLMQRVILHCDLNNFFASVECLDYPQLQGRPVAVCGSVKERHGIVLSKNEEAKRFGVKTAETVWQAKKKCPDLCVVPPHYSRYVHFSNLMQEIYQEYTDQVEPFGIDECWLDVSGSTRLFGSGREIADEIRARAKSELNLTVSVGVSFNKIFAKLGSDMKKPDATTELPYEKMQSKIWPLAVTEMMGVGKSTAQKLKAMGILTLGDLAQSEEKYLVARLGKIGHILHKNASGQNDSPVDLLKTKERPKSIGNSTTCIRDLKTNDEVKRVLLFLGDKVSSRLRQDGLAASGVQVFIRDSALHTEEHQTLLSEPSSLGKDLSKESLLLFETFYRWRLPVRALGIRAFQLVETEGPQQLSLFNEPRIYEKTKKLEEKTDDIRKKYGKNALIRASLLNALPLMKEEREHQGFGFAYQNKEERKKA